MTTVYLNGKLLPLEQAQVSVMDRGFLFGDGVYEVIPVFGGRCFRLDQHLDRLDCSLAAIHLASPHTHAQWQHICAQLIAELQRDQPAPDQMIYIQVTRGPAPLREHRFPAGVRPTVFAFTRATPASPTLPAPIACVTTDDIRWARPDIKSISLLANVLMTQEALDSGSSEAILIRDGQVLEGASSNVFIALNDVLYTAPRSRRILAGITRDLIVELAPQYPLPLREQAIAADDLARAREIWITSSTRDLVPVTSL
ncbi:MAG: aminotransferase class IV, partial [Spongiibacteraceae bacterium]